MIVAAFRMLGLYLATSLVVWLGWRIAVYALGWPTLQFGAVSWIVLLAWLAGYGKDLAVHDG